MTATGVITWSQTAASNGTADSSVNFAEGMSPAQVNDSARALMASVAKWRDDLAGSIVTTGTSTAYSVASNQIEAALTAGYVIAFSPHTTNGATVTLNVDGLGDKPLRSAPGVELPAGVLVEGTPYAATYYSSNSGEWILQGFYGQPYGVPVGGMLPYVGSTAPTSNFVLPYGQALSRTTYSTLFGLCGTVFGSGDGSTTFNIPDLRGRVPFGLDNMGGTAASRITSDLSGNFDGTVRGNTGGSQSHTLTEAELPSLTKNLSLTRTVDVTGLVYYSHSSNAQGSSNDVVTSINAPTTGSAQSISITQQPTFSGTVSFGSGTAHSIMPPSIIVPWLLRVI